MSRWQLVQDLFAETVAMPDAERARVLREKAGGDEALVQEVEGLVRADRQPLSELDCDAAELFKQLEVTAAPERLCGTTTGNYCIDAHLASGGMAHVYRATRRTAGTERRVALKVLREGADSDALLQRFHHEQRTLALLEHEHIVAFLDAGVLPDARPYLVMEYVDGVPLTQWVHDKPLTKRLQLFVTVLATVQYAHSQLVVHQDLKPSNILVTMEGTPKLVDFGVATLLESAQGSVTGGGPLTPVYASPEQLAGNPVTVASDVFALGVVLRELIAGGPDKSIAATDLRCIVERACADDPASRYRSVADLAEDLRRFLGSEPLAMRAGSWSYRTRLFTRRHRWPVLLAATVMVSLAVGWVSADLRRDSARREASLGWGAHAQVKMTARVYERWIMEVAQASPEMGTLAISHLERELSGRVQEFPETETLVRLSLARLYLERDQREPARRHAERAVLLGETTRGVGPKDLERARELLQRSQ